MSNFLLPVAFWGMAIAPLIVLMYLLKLRRTPVRIASTLLWRRSVQDMVANAPFQRLRNNLLLWLQLLILALLVFALARPVFLLGGVSGSTVILMIDRSASMQTVEADGKTRLDKAKELAEDAIENLGTRDQMMILGFANTTQPVQAMTGDKTLLSAAVRSLTALDTETDLEMAGLLLQERTTIRADGDAIVPNESVSVLLLSDGGLGPGVASLGDVPNIDFVSIGDETDNLGFASVDVRESFSGDFEYQVFASVYNSGASDRDVFVEMELDGTAVDLKKVSIPARKEAAVIFTLGPEARGLATLRFPTHRDAYALDDEIQVMVSPPTEIKVLIVSNGNPFIERAFSVDPRTKVSIIRPTEYTAREDFDITVFENATAGDLPTGNFLFVNSLPPERFGYRHEPGDEVRSPRVIDWNRVHPIMRYANFDNVLVAGAKKMTSPQGALTLVEAANVDLISLLENEERRIVVVNFDIMKSYWPVDVSYPIFISNFIDYANRRGSGMEKPAFATGEQIPILPPKDARTATVTGPGGLRQEIDLSGRSVAWFPETSRKGLHTVRFDNGETRQWPVNALSRVESDIAPVREITLGARRISATEKSIKSKREIWHWLALAGLGILLLEWGVYCRRTFM